MSSAFPTFPVTARTNEVFQVDFSDWPEFRANPADTIVSVAIVCTPTGPTLTPSIVASSNNGLAAQQVNIWGTGFAANVTYTATVTPQTAGGANLSPSTIYFASGS